MKIIKFIFYKDAASLSNINLMRIAAAEKAFFEADDTLTSDLVEPFFASSTAFLNHFKR